MLNGKVNKMTNVTEKELVAASVAPRVTQDDVIHSINKEEYFSHGLNTFCILTLQNGFTITGESACASPENFNKEIGQRLAKSDAVDKIWAFLGFELRTKLKLIEDAPNPGGLIHTLGSPKTYVGTKVIHALEMSLGEYNKLRGWGMPANEDPKEEGYLVEYTNGGVPNVPGFGGYISWCPKEVFVKVYGLGVKQRPTNWLTRVHQEYKDLIDRILRTSHFIESAEFKDISGEDQTDVINQLAAMKIYAECLERRIVRASPSGDAESV